MATGIEWTAWSDSGASGKGTVHLTVDGSPETATADLQLSGMSVNGNNGPQFTHLTVTWLGRSPDGHLSDSYQLGNG